MNRTSEVRTADAVLRRWIGIARRIAKQAYRRRVTPDFSVVAAGLEEGLLSAFVMSYRRGLREGRRMTPLNRQAARMKTIWNEQGVMLPEEATFQQKKDNRRAAGFWLFAAGAGLVAVAVTNTVARVVDWLNRQFRAAVGMPVGKPLGIGPGGVVPADVTLPTPIYVPERVVFHPQGYPNQPVPPEPGKPAQPQVPPSQEVVEEGLKFPVASPLSIVEDQLYDLSQRAIVEYAKQVGAELLEWEVEKANNGRPDARVCKICLPLDGVRAKPGEPFGFNQGQPIYNAPVHGRCRCRLRVARFSKGKP